MYKYDKSNAIKILKINREKYPHFEDTVRFVGILYIFEDGVVIAVDRFAEERWFKCSLQVNPKDYTFQDIYYNSVLHREDGPAIRQVGTAILNRQDYYYNGEFFNCKTTKEFQTLLKLKAFW
jgi:hypothetical protein